ncbi:MAG: tyrosine--tRNA ligase [Kiritimatiellae bacterium]|nr:tyrosine--tRNA ligase [Kiritimatiellia bacterium]
MRKELEQQMRRIAARAVDVVSWEELEQKLRRSLETGVALRVKYGADPSAPDLHLGHVVGLNKLREFQDLGHTVVFIIGDITAMIGDPSGRSQTRKPLSEAQVREHAASYQEQVFRVLDPERTELRFNSEWFKNMNFGEIIGLSSRVTVAQMLAREDFAQRYAGRQPISLVEFLYPLVQAYDSVMVQADLELGGTDQLFNLLLGREIQKSFGQEPQIALTLPLIEGLDGVQKMSKSLGNYIGISEPAREIFGKTMSLPDALMERYFSLVLCEDSDQVAARASGLAAGRIHPREAKEELARKIAARFAGADAADAAAEEFRRVFSRHELPEEIPELDLTDEERREGVRLGHLLVRAGLASSQGEARRLAQQGAVRINDERATDAAAVLHPAPGTVIRSGKRGFVRIRG